LRETKAQPAFARWAECRSRGDTNLELGGQPFREVEAVLHTVDLEEGIERCCRWTVDDARHRGKPLAGCIAAGAATLDHGGDGVFAVPYGDDTGLLEKFRRPAGVVFHQVANLFRQADRVG
jgi:hypothetical protein